MSVAVDEGTTALQQAAEQEWKAIRDGLSGRQIQVLLAATYDKRHKPGSTHILALHAIQVGRRFVPGLNDDSYVLFPAESAFCGVPRQVRTLQFRIWRSRNEEHLVGPPSCPSCIRSLHSLTGAPVDALQAYARTKRSWHLKPEIPR